MNESELDSRGARELPELKIASLLMWFEAGAEVAHRIGLDFDLFDGVRSLCRASAEALRRGARVREIVGAVECIRAEPSREIEDEQTVRRKLPFKIEPFNKDE